MILQDATMLAPPPEPATPHSVKDMDFKGLITDKASNTGMHGIPNLTRSNSWFRKIFWLLLVVGGLCEYYNTPANLPPHETLLACD